MNTQELLGVAAKPAEPDECPATGFTCNYKAEGPKGEFQCCFCGSEQPAKEEAK